MFKYYVSKLGGRIKTFIDNTNVGGVQKLGKLADVILEQSPGDDHVFGQILE